MRSTLLRTLPVLLLVACASGGGGAPAPSARAIARAAPEGHAPRTSAFDVEHYALQLELLAEQRALRGTCTVRLYPVVEDLAQVELDLVDLEVERVRDAADRALGFVHAGGVLTIQLAEPRDPGEPVELAIDYGGVPRRGLWYRGLRDGVPTQAFTQGECEDARGWFPCWDFPSDRATSSIDVTLPAGWRALAAGERIEREELPDGRARELWRMHDRHPTYLVTLAAGELVERRWAWDGVPLVVLAEERFGPWIEDTFAETDEVLAFLSEVTGRRYPYAKYGQACMSGFQFGGMENVSATTLTDTILRDERGLRDYDPSGLICHEAAHQWFGDLLTCADWSHIWLNEGFATYLTLLYVEETRGLDAFRAQVRDAQDAYVAGDVGANRRPTVHAVYTEPMDLFFGGHTYQGGASRLHLLRFVLGDEAFFAGLRRYVADHADRPVVTDDLRRSMEAASGRDLGWFFEQWLEGAGYPELRTRWSWDPQAGVARVEVEQVQEPRGGTPAAFRGPVAIEVREESGARLHRVQLERRSQTFELPAGSEPVWVRFDKGGWWPKRVDAGKKVREWLALAAWDDDVNGRRDALAVLGRVARDSKERRERDVLCAALVRGLAADPAPAARVTAAKALAGLAGDGQLDARSALLAAARGDERAEVRVAALEALAALGPDAQLADFARGVFEEGFSWATMGAAARLVAAADPQGAHAWLVERLELRSPHDLLLADLARALARLGGAAQAEVLRALAQDRARGERGREAAVQELGRLRRDRAHLRRDLEELLDPDEAFRVRGAAIEALGALGDPAALPALRRAHAQSRDTRHRRAVERVLRDLAVQP